MSTPEAGPLATKSWWGEEPAQKSTRRTLLVALAWLIVFCGVVVMLARAIHAFREAARCAECGFNLGHLASGLRYFDMDHGGLPPAYVCDEKGRRIHSWQTLVMPFTSYYAWRRWYSLREPWNGPNNCKVPPRASSRFQCPSADGADDRSTIDYVAVVGPDTMWPGRERVKLPEGGRGRETILLIEMPNSDCRFLDPRSPTVDEFMARICLPTGKGIRCIHPRGLAYVTIGGEVGWFPPDTDPETIRKLLKRDPGCQVLPPPDLGTLINEWERRAKESK